VAAAVTNYGGEGWGVVHMPPDRRTVQGGGAVRSGHGRRVRKFSFVLYPVPTEIMSLLHSTN
jgi:hypothetical protein